MSLDPKTLRPDVHADVHEVLSVLADLKGMGLNAFVAKVLKKYCEKRSTDHTVTSHALERTAMVRKIRERSGK